MKRMPGILLIVLLLLGACSTEETTGDFPQGTIPIGFSGDVENTETRAAQEYATTADLTNIGVFASFTSGNFNPSTSTPNFMYNQKVARTNATSPWTYSPARYWPNNTTDKISFFVYAPYVDHAAAGGSNPTLSSNVTVGYPTLTYTVPAAEANQTDLLAGVPFINRTYAVDNGTIKFTMNHAMTKVAVYVKSNDNVAGKKITSFSIKAAKTGTLTYHASTGASDKGFTWSYPTPVTQETFTTTATSFAVPDTKTAAKKLLATFFLLPSGENSTFSITYTAPGTTSTGTVITQTISLTDKPLPSLDKWAPGAVISYTIGIEKKQITVTTSTHPTWTDDGNGTVDGQPVTTYIIPPPDVEWEEGNNEIINGSER